MIILPGDPPARTSGQKWTIQSKLSHATRRRDMTRNKKFLLNHGELSVQHMKNIAWLKYSFISIRQRPSFYERLCFQPPEWKTISQQNQLSVFYLDGIENKKIRKLTAQNSSKEIFPSSSLSANRIVLSTICWSWVSFKLLPTIIFNTYRKQISLNILNMCKTRLPGTILHLKWLHHYPYHKCEKQSGALIPYHP